MCGSCASVGACAWDVTRGRGWSDGSEGGVGRRRPDLRGGRNEGWSLPRGFPSRRLPFGVKIGLWSFHALSPSVGRGCGSFSPRCGRLPIQSLWVRRKGSEGQYLGPVLSSHLPSLTRTEGGFDPCGAPGRAWTRTLRGAPRGSRSGLDDRGDRRGPISTPPSPPMGGREVFGGPTGTRCLFEDGPAALQRTQARDPPPREGRGPNRPRGRGGAVGGSGGAAAGGRASDAARAFGPRAGGRASQTTTGRNCSNAVIQRGPL